MFPVIQFLIAIFIAKECMDGTLVASVCVCDSLWTPVWTVVAVAAIWPVGILLQRMAAVELSRARDDVGAWESAMLRLHRRHYLFRAAPILSYFVAALGAGWPRMVALGRFGGTVLVDDLISLLPFLGAQLVTWIIQYGLDRRMSGRVLQLGPYLRFQGRQILLPLFPVLGLLALLDILDASSAYLYFLAYPFLHTLIVLTVLIVLYALSGLLVRVIFRTRPLPPGPLRDRLEAFSERAGFRCRNLLVWSTGLRIINAAIIGGWSRHRHVLFTDGMLESFTDGEIEAVFAHEVGHAKCGHLHLYFIFAVTLLFVFVLTLEAVQAVAPECLVNHGLFYLGLFVAVVVIYWRVVFGFVSRKFEREADLFATIALGDHRRFTEALEEVARKSGTLRTLPSWRHFSIAQRVEFLQQAFADVNVLDRFRRAVRRIKVVLVLVLVVTACVALRNLGPMCRAGGAFVGGVHAMEAGAPERAIRALGAGPDDPVGTAYLRETVGQFVHREGDPTLGRLAAAAMLDVSAQRLEAGDLNGAIARFRQGLEYGRYWTAEMTLRADRLRRRLRRTRDAGDGL